MVLLTVLMDFRVAISASMRVRLVQMTPMCRLLLNEGWVGGGDVDDDDGDEEELWSPCEDAGDAFDEVGLPVEAMILLSS